MTVHPLTMHVSFCFFLPNMIYYVYSGKEEDV